MRDLPLIERRIIDAILDAAAARGWLVSVHDGEQWALAPSRDRAAIAGAIGATEQTMLRLRDPNGWPDPKHGPLVGDVDLIHGNGCDVIHDYSDVPALSEMLAPALALADEAAR